MSELGLPELTAAPARKERAYVEYTVPKDMVEPEFFDKFQEADLTFGLTSPRPHEMEQAGKLAGSNPVALAREVLFTTLYKIGSWDPKRSRDATRQSGLEAWWDLVGPKVRDLINEEFVNMVQPSEDEAERFRASRKTARG